MNNKSTHSKELIANLILDANNPRFAELYSGSSNEEDLIEYLLYSEAAEEVAQSIKHTKEFYPDESLWVLKEKGKYLVKDGNRRCAAVKALQNPIKYQLNLNKFSIHELPILIFEDENYLNHRIREKHTSHFFREWERIAKALQVYTLYTSGSSIDSMREFDSQPNQLIKLASFYYEAVTISGESLKKLLRRGKGRTGGKTIVFERLFKYSKLCGYSFKTKPSYQINISDQSRFSKYISAIVEYLENNPQTSHKTIDSEGERFLDKLKKFGFNKELSKINNIEDEEEDKQNSEKNGDEKKSADNFTPTEKRGSIKNKPKFTRKMVPSALNRLIKECYDLDHNNFSNAKTALTRVTFECTLKYVVENTKYNSKNLSELVFFQDAFFDKRGGERQFTNFEKLKEKFTDLIKNRGKNKAFKNFNLDGPHQIIHNYNVGAIPNDAKSLCDNLIPLLEFMLQDEYSLMESLDISKL